MKTKITGIMAALGLLAVASTAFAFGDTNYFVIRNLDYTAEGVRVYQPGSASTNPGACAQTDYYEPAVLTPPEREAFDKALTSAFLAGRQVRLFISGCGANNRPAYVIVRLDAAK
jgi:hypothetical protein